MPLVFLMVPALLNIALDFFFVLGLGVSGAVEATVIAQYAAGLGLAIYTQAMYPEFREALLYARFSFERAWEIARFSLLTCV